MKILEEFRPTRAKRKASTSVLYATIAAVVSAVFAGANVVISIIALYSE